MIMPKITTREKISGIETTTREKISGIETMQKDSAKINKDKLTKYPIFSRGLGSWRGISAQRGGNLEKLELEESELTRRIAYIVQRYWKTYAPNEQGMVGVLHAKDPLNTIFIGFSKDDNNDKNNSFLEKELRQKHIKDLLEYSNNNLSLKKIEELGNYNICISTQDKTIGGHMSFSGKVSSNRLDSNAYGRCKGIWTCAATKVISSAIVQLRQIMSYRSFFGQTQNIGQRGNSPDISTYGNRLDISWNIIEIIQNWKMTEVSNLFQSQNYPAGQRAASCKFCSDNLLRLLNLHYTDEQENTGDSSNKGFKKVGRLTRKDEKSQKTKARLCSKTRKNRCFGTVLDGNVIK